jgi:hypothetical protein
MTRAAHHEIRRLTRLHEGTELELMLLTDRTFLTAAERAKVNDLERRKLQLQERIAWFEAILYEHEQRANDAAE